MRDVSVSLLLCYWIPVGRNISTLWIRFTSFSAKNNVLPAFKSLSLRRTTLHIHSYRKAKSAPLLEENTMGFVPQLPETFQRPTVQQNARKTNDQGEKCAVTMNRLMKSHTPSRYAAFGTQLDLYIREKRYRCGSSMRQNTLSASRSTRHGLDRRPHHKQSNSQCFEQCLRFA